jgi:hypothetical protein
MRIAALALLLGTAFTAPAGDTASTRAPRVVVLKPDDLGRIEIAVMADGFEERFARDPAGKGFARDPADPNRVLWEIRSTRKQFEMPVTSVKDLKFYDTAGKEVLKADALKALAKGGTVVVSGDGKAVDPAFLATVPKGTLVLVAPDLVLEKETKGPWGPSP